MYLILRIIRAVIGVAAGFQFAGTTSFIRKEFIETPISGDGLTLLVIRLAILALFVGAFIGIRNFINNLHNKKFNKPHPALNTPWAL